MSTHEKHLQEEEHSGGHVVSVTSYLLVWAALMVLLFATVGAAYVSFGHHALNVAILFAIAIAKTILIVLIFMHVRWSSRVTAVFVVSGFLWLAIMFAFTISDFLSRQWIGAGTPW